MTSSFDLGQGRGSSAEDYLNRAQLADQTGFGFDRKSIVDIDGLPTATNIQASPKVIDEIIHPDLDNKYFSAYPDTDITPDARDYLNKNPAVTSVDFNVSYPGYKDFDYHPFSTSNKSDGFVDSFQEINKRHPIFAGSLKKRLARVNEVFDANPELGDSVSDDVVWWDPDGKQAKPQIRRVNFTADDSKRLSQSLNNDLIDMFREAPEGTTFVNNPDSSSRAKLYTRSANFSSPDTANNQFVTKGPRGSLRSFQMTDPTAPTFGPSNFDTNPNFIRTVKEMIDPDSVPEIKKLSSFERSLYQKPTARDLARPVTRFATDVFNNPRAVSGLAGTALTSPEAASKLREGDYVGAAADTGLGYLAGEGTAGAFNLGINALRSRAPEAATKLVQATKGLGNLGTPLLGLSALDTASTLITGKNSRETLVDSDNTEAATAASMAPISIAPLGLAGGPIQGNIPKSLQTGLKKSKAGDQRIQEARDRGGRWKVGSFAIPDFGLSEGLEIN